MEIVKTYRESMPALRLIGRMYTDADRNEFGSFGHLWGEWFSQSRFGTLEALGPVEDSYLGAMIVYNGVFEYWIGMFFPENTAVPEGYQYADFPATDYGVCWLYGKEDTGELFGMDAHESALGAMEAAGMTRDGETPCIERYNCPRFTTPDDKGNVILDYLVAVSNA